MPGLCLVVGLLAAVPEQIIQAGRCYPPVFAVKLIFEEFNGMHGTGSDLNFLF
jgi:hypothetical protein